MNHRAKRIFALFASAALLFVAVRASADTGAVVGYVTLDIAAGTNSSPKVSTISLPLYAPLSGDGAVAGRLTGVSEAALENSAAGWTAGEFAGGYFLKITSGAAAGRIFAISSNTSTSATVNNQGVDLATLGIATGSEGDTYEIFPADTILSVFGTPEDGVLGGASADAADQVQLYSASAGWETFYFSTTDNAWKSADGSVDGDGRIIRPDEGVIYLRRGTTPLQIVLTGRVPDTAAQIVVQNTGSFVVGSTWPVDTTLATSGIQNIDGWGSGTLATADQVQIYSEADGWRSYYYNGANWVHVGRPVVSDDEPIKAGTAVLLVRRGSASGTAVLSQAMPYDLEN